MYQLGYKIHWNEFEWLVKCMRKMHEYPPPPHYKMILSNLLGNQPLLNLLPKFFSVSAGTKNGKLEVLSFDLTSYTMTVKIFLGISTYSVKQLYLLSWWVKLVVSFIQNFCEINYLIQLSVARFSSMQTKNPRCDLTMNAIVSINFTKWVVQTISHALWKNAKFTLTWKISWKHLIVLIV